MVGCVKTVLCDTSLSMKRGNPDHMVLFRTVEISNS